MTDEAKAILAVVLVFICIPAALGWAANSARWQDLVQQNHVLGEKAEALFYPIDGQ